MLIRIQKRGRQTGDFMSSLKASVQRTMQQGRAKLEQTFSEAEKMRKSMSDSLGQTTLQGQACVSSPMALKKEAPDIGSRSQYHPPQEQAVIADAHGGRTGRHAPVFMSTDADILTTSD